MTVIGRPPLPPSWHSSRLEEVVDILDSRRVPVNGKERAGRVGSIPYYGATGQVGWIDEHLFDEELVLLGEDGAPFLEARRSKAYIVRGKSWVNNHAHVLRAKPGLKNSFLLHQLNILDYRPFVSGTTRLKLPQGTMRNIPLAVAPEPEQVRIVEEIEKQFTRLDAGIAALRRVQANLKRYRASVLKAACEGRLVPTEHELAKAERRTYETGDDLRHQITDMIKRIRHASKSNLKNLAEPQNFRTLPKGWTMVKLEDIYWDASYGTSVKCSYKETGHAVLRIPNVCRGRIDLSDLKFAPTSLVMKNGECLTVGDILVIRTNGSKALIGRSAIILSDLPIPCAYASYLIRFRLPNIPILMRWLTIHWQSHHTRVWIEKRAATSAGQHNISLSTLNTFPIPLPPIAEQERIVAEVERRLSVADELETLVTANLKRADRLRQSILDRAFSGQL